MTPPFSGHTQASHCWWVEIYFPITSYKMSKTSGMITISQQHSHLEMVFLCPMMTSRWAASGSWILGFHQAMLQKDGWLPNEKCRKTSHFSCRDDYQLFSYFKNSWGLLSLLFSKKSWLLAPIWPPFSDAQVRQRPSLTLTSLKASARSWRAKKVICMIAYISRRLVHQVVWSEWMNQCSWNEWTT